MHNPSLIIKLLIDSPTDLFKLAKVAQLPKRGLFDASPLNTILIGQRTR